MSALLDRQQCVAGGGQIDSQPLRQPPGFWDVLADIGGGGG